MTADDNRIRSVLAAAAARVMAGAEAAISTRWCSPRPYTSRPTRSASTISSITLRRRSPWPMGTPAFASLWVSAKLVIPSSNLVAALMRHPFGSGPPRYTNRSAAVPNHSGTGQPDLCHNDRAGQGTAAAAVVWLGKVPVDMPTGVAVAQRNNADVLATMEREGVVPVFNDADIRVTKEVARCIVAGGLSTFEFTNRGEGALDVFAEFVTWAGTALPELTVGVGTITEAVAAERAIELGAAFVFAPSLSGSVAVVCSSRGVPYVPGCGTVTEIQTAYDLGCEMVKLFPAESLGGPAFLSAVRAPCPWVRAIPTGGVEPTVASMKPWFDAGAPAVGMGSNLLPKDLVAAGNWDAIDQRVAAAVGAVEQARA